MECWDGCVVYVFGGGIIVPREYDPPPLIIIIIIGAIKFFINLMAPK